MHKTVTLRDRSGYQGCHQRLSAEISGENKVLDVAFGQLRIAEVNKDAGCNGLVQDAEAQHAGVSAGTKTHRA